MEKPSISNNKVYEFKKEVEIQLMKYLGRLSPEIGMHTYAKGINGCDYYDVDIHIIIEGKGLFANRGDIWAECEWQNNSPIRDSDIQRLVNKAQDVLGYARESGGFYFDSLIMVSNQEFDINALSYANKLDVLCLRFYQGQLTKQNTSMNWAGDPAWMNTYIKLLYSNRELFFVKGH